MSWLDQWDHTRNALVTGCRRSGIQLWDVESGQKIVHFLGHNTKNQINIVKVRVRPESVICSVGAPRAMERGLIAVCSHFFSRATIESSRAARTTQSKSGIVARERARPRSSDTEAPS